MIPFPLHHSIGQTAQLITVDNNGLKNIFVYPETDKRCYTQPQQAQPTSQQLSRRHSYSNNGSGNQTPNFPPSMQQKRFSQSANSSPLLRSNSTDPTGKKSRLSTELIAPSPSYWDGNAFTCAHTRMTGDEMNVNPSLSKEAAEDRELIYRVLSYVNQKGYLRVDV